MQFGHLIRTNATDGCSLINSSVMRWKVRQSVNAVSWETVFTLLVLLSTHVLQIWWNIPAVRNSESHWTVQAFFGELNLVIMQVRWKLASHIEKFIVAYNSATNRTISLTCRRSWMVLAIHRLNAMRRDASTLMQMYCKGNCTLAVTFSWLLLKQKWSAGQDEFADV